MYKSQRVKVSSCVFMGAYVPDYFSAECSNVQVWRRLTNSHLQISLEPLCATYSGTE